MHGQNHIKHLELYWNPSDVVTQYNFIWYKVPCWCTLFMSTNVEQNVFNVRYTEFPDKTYCTVVVFDALPLKSTRSYTSCTWSCSKSTECVRTLVNPRKHRTKVRTGSYWIHPRASWRMEASRRVIPPLTSWWLRQLRHVETCLTLYGAIKNTRNVWNTKRYILQS